MKVVFYPQQFRQSKNKTKISVEGTFQGLGIDFLAVISRLYQLPCLWFSEGIFIELDFESEKLILKAPEDKGEDFHAQEVVQEIPIRELISLSIGALHDKYIRPFAANLAENNFGMLKTAKAIRENWRSSLISEIAMEEGHPVLDTEIENLLFRKNWEIESSYRIKQFSMRA